MPPGCQAGVALRVAAAAGGPVAMSVEIAVAIAVAMLLRLYICLYGADARGRAVFAKMAEKGAFCAISPGVNRKKIGSVADLN